MKSCFLFGHRDTPHDIQSAIEAAVERQYLNHGARQYYVGGYGSFDSMATSAVKRVKKRYHDISLYACFFKKLLEGVHICLICKALQHIHCGGITNRHHVYEQAVIAAAVQVHGFNVLCCYIISSLQNFLQLIIHKQKIKTT